MKVKVFGRCEISEQSPVLFLEPESNEDQETLRRLLDEFHIAGMGRTADLSQIKYIEMPLEERDRRSGGR